MEAIVKIKTKLKEQFSSSFQYSQKVNKYSSKQYGFTPTKAGTNINTSTIELSVARHTLPHDALVGFDKISNSNTNKTLTNNTINKIKNPDNTNDANSIDSLLGEVKKELNLGGSKNDKAEHLYALSKIAENMGARFETGFADQQGHRKELVILIDDNAQDPAKAITTVMMGLGIHNKDMINNVINRFNQQTTELQTPEKLTQHNRTNQTPENNTKPVRPDPTPVNTTPTQNKGIQIN